MADYRYRLDKRLIVVDVVIVGKSGRMHSAFILDTGASYTVVDPSITDILGYSVRDASGFSTVASAVGREKGYRLIIEGIEAIGKHVPNIEVACHDLKEQGIEGLLGMDFLEQFDWCLHPKRHVLAVMD